MTQPIRLGALVSGGGTTLQNFLDRIDAGELNASVVLVISSNPGAFGLERAKKRGIPSMVIERKDYADTKSFSTAVFDALSAADVDLACLAGYLKLLRIPKRWEGRVMNIHPALIPSFCGPGFYGHTVHQSVIDYGTKVSGCTVHFCTNEYDAGPIILQRTCPVLDDDDADALAARVFREECIAYPEAIRLFAEGCLRIEGRRVRVRKSET